MTLSPLRSQRVVGWGAPRRRPVGSGRWSRHGSSSRSRSRGKLVVGEPYFLPGTPIVLDRKSLHGAERGDLAVVASGRGRAKVERVLGQADRIESVLEGLLVERGRADAVRALRPARADAGRAHRSARPDYLHDRSRHGEGLRRRDLGRARGGRRPRLGAHRRRLLVHRHGLGARPWRRRPRLLDLRARAGRADAAARALRRRLLAAAARRPVVRDGRDPADRGAALLPLGDPQRRAAHLRAGATPRRPGGGRGRARARRRATRPSCAGGGSPAGRYGSTVRRSHSSSTARAASPTPDGRASRRRTRSSRS